MIQKIPTKLIILMAVLAIGLFGCGGKEELRQEAVKEDKIKEIENKNK
ncbi:MAG: hypothetical protein GF335_04935, partial [Candidatus Moranbacteria bacterium]|nr:hypothetical protein [Candidatus Moranbacteria bacterium]